MEDNEQWLSGGNCDKCRRNKYCSTPCTRNIRRHNAIVRGLVKDSLNRMTGGCMREAIDQTVDGIMR